MPGGKLAMQKVWSISKVPVLLQMAKASSLGGKTLAWVSLFLATNCFYYSCKSFHSLTISYRGGNVKELFYFTDHFMQKTEQLCGVMTEYFFDSTRKREKTVKPQANFSFCECNAKNPKQTNKRHSKSRWDSFDRKRGGTRGGGGCVWQRDRDRDGDGERKIIYETQ